MTSRLVVAVPLLAALAAPVARAADEKAVVQRGAQASAPVKAVVLNVDVRDLPVARDWEPGDPIKEVPRRFYPQPGDRVGDPPAPETPWTDRLLAVQEAAPPPSDFDFPTPILNFDAQNFTGVNPPDTVGDVGPNHYVHAINTSGGTRVVIYDKTGVVVGGPFELDTLGAPSPCNAGFGDPVVLYDSLANRWMLTEFASSGSNLCVYISQTPNPVSGGWFFYRFTTPSFPDYPKYAVWPDAYYVGTNEGNAPPAYALDRAKMLAGQPATFQRFTAPGLAGFGFEMMVPADLDGATPPPAGAPGVFLRHRDDEVHNPPGNPAQDFIDLFEFHVDWTTPANSTFTGPTAIPISEFSSELCGLTSFNCFPQPGSGVTLDPLREVFMFRAQYRNFGTHQSIAGNFVTDADGEPDTPANNERGGIRWVELRKPGATWVLQQEGTYSPDITPRWMGASALDGDGNFAVAYNVSDATSVFPGLRYAGRRTTDPEGTLPQGESTIVSGTAASSSNRYGDYAAMSVDPADNCTFWFTGMYNPAGQWRTRVATFKFNGCGGPAVPDFSLAAGAVVLNRGGSANTTVTVSSTTGFTGPVTLSASGLPAGISVSFNPPVVTPPPDGQVTSTATVSASPTATTGTFTITFTGTSGPLVRNTSVGLTVNPGGGPQSAVFNAALGTPRCSTVGSSCDSGASLLLGRDGIGPEPNAPNTIASACADGSVGAFHVDESIDRLAVVSVDTSNFAPAKTVRIDATVWAFSSFTADKLDLYYTGNANAPDWIYLTTLTPTAAGAQTLSATYLLPSGPLQAVRARFRYHGKAAACGRGSYDDHDDLVFAVDAGVQPPDNAAAFDAGFQAPRCAAAGRSCDSGPIAVQGRDGRGPEPNQPNTLLDACADGTSGLFHSDESNDRVRVATQDGSVLAAGKTVRVEATVWAHRDFTADKLDLYFAASASAPVWTLITTLTPNAAGLQTLGATYTLPAGATQAIRARFRYLGAAAPCGTGAYDDADDLVFAVP
jgi:hypothetical protein